MKQLIKIAIIFTVLMVIAFILLMYINKSTDFKGRDITEYNRMQYDIYDDYNAGETIEALEKQYNCSIILTTELVEAEITKFYREGALVIDFAPEGEIIGKIAWNDLSDVYEDKENTLLKAVIIMWFAILAAGYIFLVFLYLSIVRPIRDFESFSGEIAKGNLEVTLPMRKDNLFGNFTESFDQMREELIRSRKREAEAEKAKRELVGEISHDIKTPVSTIKATCEVMDMNLIKREKSAESDDEIRFADDMKEKVGYISEKAEMINQLVQNVFHVTMEEIDELQTNVSEKDSKQIENYFLRLKNYGKIILDNHIPECLVYMDSLRMEQVIDNIVGNSYKYAGTDIHVSFEETEAAYDLDGNTIRFIRIKVSDSGPGVDDEELPLLTEKFYRGKDTKDKNGYGLGLYLVKWYMEKQGGGMEYYNDNGFTVELLVKKV